MDATLQRMFADKRHSEEDDQLITTPWGNKRWRSIRQSFEQRDRLLKCLKALVAMNNCNYDRGTTDYMVAMTQATAAIANAEHGA